MSFKIRASGSRGFYYVRNNNIDGDEFDTLKVLNTLGFMDHSVAGVVDAGLGHVSPGITDLYVAQANFVYLHTLKLSVDLLAAQPGAHKGWISVYSRETNRLWTDTKRFSQYRFLPGNNPGKEFVDTIAKDLEATDMNNFGVLMALSIVLSKYKSKLRAYDRPMISIRLLK